MTRFFYRDPLAAAWMAREFGMRFDAWVQGGILSSCYKPGEVDLSPEECFKNPEVLLVGEKFFVHPDSLHLLEPQIGDLLAVRFTSPALPMPSLPDHFVLACPWEEAEWELEYLDHRIIQRQGVQFMWPESE